jgi:hypothetical protein
LREILGVSEENSWKFLGTGGGVLWNFSEKLWQDNTSWGALGNSSLKKLWPFALL